MVYFIFIIILTAISIIALESFIATDFFTFSRTTTKQLNIILDNESDEDLKQDLLIKNLKKLLIFFGIVILKIALLLGLLFLPIYLFFSLTKQDISTFSLTNWKTLLPMFIGSFILLRPKKSKQDYTYWSKLLHYLVLDNYNLSKKLFRKKGDSKLDDLKSKKFVVISGLARAGTTAFTKKLYDWGAFHSLTYADMPFLLSPHISKRITLKSNSKVKERSHGDGVMIGTNSIEALDEYFFKVFLNDSYINEKTLSKHVIPKDVYENYLRYQAQISQNKETVYITKNNNFILRYQGIRNYNDAFLYLIIIREPLDHARSLMNQHHLQSKQQQEDPFILDFMNWLGHHEFGKNHKTFEFNNYTSKKVYKTNNLNYWLTNWINYYLEVEKIIQDKNTFLVTYNSIINKFQYIQKRLAIELNIDSSMSINEEKFTPTAYEHKDIEVDSELLSIATELFNRLAKHDITST